ncbi:hypothetical protein HNR01_001783 [Methylorubrum rhodesianum]|uniref:hypothetical protein n=1 Tax=Methylorubrum rhodesianum TaxID=29427 RepID=UPI00161CE73E|nr:hypothetical protein [Methylorubrum rhodesianum]MBB5762163.1 hypothetical protein [Methylorubrum rhodesianum]
MPDEEQFYMGPIELGYYSYIDLLEGPLQIEHLVEINEAMSYSAENRRRIQEAQRPNG